MVTQKNNTKLTIPQIAQLTIKEFILHNKDIQIDEQKKEKHIFMILKKNICNVQKGSIIFTIWIKEYFHY